MTALGSKNGMQRQKARLILVAIGEPTVDFLAELAFHPQWIIRWEAVKALSQIKNAVAAPILINALEDEYEGIRWLAAEGLIALGKQGLIPMLEALTSYRLTIFLREGAHHVFKKLSKRYTLTGMEELMESLENTDSYFRIPINARAMLNEILKNNNNPPDSYLQLK